MGSASNNGKTRAKKQNKIKKRKCLIDFKKLKPFITQKIYQYIKYLEKKGYKKHLDTNAENIVTKNKIANFIETYTDLICYIMVIANCHQRLSTYITVMTIAAYICVSNIKEFSIVAKQLNKNNNLVLYVRNKSKKEKTYPVLSIPYLKNIIASGAICVLLFFMLAFEFTGFYQQPDFLKYMVVLIIIIFILASIKMKNLFLDTFCIEEFDIRFESKFD